MPTYDYICLSCGQEQEIFHSIHEKLDRRCTECKEGVLEKQISRTSGIIFKGSGFYETDYKQKISSPVEHETKGSCNHKSACGCTGHG